MFLDFNFDFKKKKQKATLKRKTFMLDFHAFSFLIIRLRFGLFQKYIIGFQRIKLENPFVEFHLDLIRHDFLQTFDNHFYLNHIWFEIMAPILPFLLFQFKCTIVWNNQFLKQWIVDLNCGSMCLKDANRTILKTIQIL